MDGPLTGADAMAYHEQVKARSLRVMAEQLAAAKADAARRGKEPFDLAKLETLCDTSHEGRVDPVETRQAERERQYYVYYPDVMTLAEYATRVDELNRW